MRTPLAALLVSSVLCASAWGQDAPPAGLEAGLYAELETSEGSLLAKLDYERAPRTVANFVGLAEGTKAFQDSDGKWVKRPFYDGLGFHRVIEGFMIQGGCPQGTGMGGPGYGFRDEVDRALTHDAAGVLSMANSDRGKTAWSGEGNTNGSQFFITLGPTPHLDGLHSVFGRLVRGQETLQAIGKKPTGANDKPLEPVTIQRVRILRIGIGKKAIPAAEGPADPATQPAADAAAAERVRVELLCVQFRGAERGRAECDLSEAEALAAARRAEAHARLQGADFTALCRRFSDIEVREYTLVRAKNDPSFAPAYQLQPGQVSAPFVTPYGVMIARAR